MAITKTNRGSEHTKHKRIKLQKDDEVVIISGKEKGKRGKLLAIDKKRDRVFVEGANKRKRFIRPSQENPTGGVVEIEGPIHISNVMFYDSKSKKGVRLGYTVNADKTKVRVSKKRKERKEV